MRGSRLIPLLAVFSLLFTSVVYACSGQAFMSMSSMSSTMDSTAMQRGPCGEHKQDICKSVRDQMLSIRASSPGANVTLHVSTVLHFPHVAIPLFMDSSSTAGPSGSPFYPVTKSSSFLFNQVLRI